MMAQDLKPAPATPPAPLSWVSGHKGVHDLGSTHIEISNYIIEAVVLDLSKVLSGFHTYSETAVLAQDPLSLAHRMRPLFSLLCRKAG